MCFSNLQCSLKANVERFSSKVNLLTFVVDVPRSKISHHVCSYKAFTVVAGIVSEVERHSKKILQRENVEGLYEKACKHYCCDSGHNN